MSAQISLAKMSDKNTAAVNTVAVSSGLPAPTANTNLSSSPLIAPLTNAQETHSYEVDVFSQLRANLNQLEELNSRLGFMMNEVVGLIKKK